MKALFRSFVLGILTTCARMRLSRMRKVGVKVVGVTGSIGKTTCKEAIAHVLRGRFRVLCSEKSYNTEFGLPLAILELKSEFSSIIGWGKNLMLAVWKGFFGDVRYDFLILEMGVDKPGDMDQLLHVIQNLNVGVFTGVHPVHMAEGQFVDMDAIAEEKGKIMRAILSEKNGGITLINGDNEYGKRLMDSAKHDSNAPKIVAYGMNDDVKLRASEVKGGWDGLDFVATYGEVRGMFHVPILGKQHIGSLLPAIGCGMFFGMYMSDIVERMKTFTLPPGRLSAIEGVNGSRIIDSSYNASPDALRAAVDTMVELAEGHRRIFVFGNMNELGTVSAKEHREIGAYLRGKIDLLLTVGDMARLCAQEAGDMQTVSFDDALAAAEYLKPNLKKGDVVLVKGSQNKVRLERLVKVIMNDPSQAASLLARQDWADA